MSSFTQSNLIEARRVDNRGKGARGVFALVAIEPGTVIERVPVILIPESQVFGDYPGTRHSARISWYVFDWGIETKRKYVAMALGYGGLYNHSYTPNAFYRQEAPDIMEYVCHKHIEPGEEITINYNGDPDDMRPMHFPLT